MRSASLDRSPSQVTCTSGRRDDQRGSAERTFCGRKKVPHPKARDEEGSEQASHHSTKDEEAREGVTVEDELLTSEEEARGSRSGRAGRPSVDMERKTSFGRPLPSGATGKPLILSSELQGYHSVVWERQCLCKIPGVCQHLVVLSHV